MLERIMKVYYGVDRLPYKDKAREVHYPVVGGIITGENNVTKVRFYVGEVGGILNTTWVASVKKPNGSLSWRVLESSQDEDGVYVDLDIISLYADLRGQIKIGLHGYSGNMTITEDDGEYEIHGTPNIVATGEVAILVNYTPVALPRADITPTDMELILGLISQKLDIEKGIVMLSSLDDELIEELDDGQVCACIVGGYIKFYELESGSLVEISSQSVDESTIRNVIEKSISIMAQFPTLTINGYSFVSYSASFVEDLQHPYWNILYNGNTCDEEQAKGWLERTVGSKHLPLFNQEHPQLSFLMFKATQDYGDTIKNGDIVIAKLQWDNANGLRAYFVFKLSFDIDLANYYTKIEVDNGYFPNARVGKADQLHSNLVRVDHAPYLFRSTAGSSNVQNEKKIKKIIGNTMLFNQLVASDTTSVTIPSGRKYIHKTSNTQTAGTSDGQPINVVGGVDQFFDITLMFGGNDRIPNDFSVTDFNRLFPNAYYEYNSGELISVNISGTMNIGYNAYNKNGGGLIKVIAGQTYVVKGVSSGSIVELDGDENEIETTAISGRTEIELTSNTQFVNIEIDEPSEKATCCFNLKWSGIRNLDYAPFRISTQDISFSGNGVFGGAGDELLPNGVKITKMATYTFDGTESWSYLNGRFYKPLPAFLPNCKIVPNNTLANWLSNIYPIAKELDVEGTMCCYNNNIFVKDSSLSGDVSALQAKLSGSTFMYEVITPTTSTQTGFDEDEWVDDYGTEEYISASDIPCPVNHETNYTPNAQNFIDVLMNYTECDPTKLQLKGALMLGAWQPDNNEENVGDITFEPQGIK